MLFKIINSNEDSARSIGDKYPILSKYAYHIVDNVSEGIEGYIHINSLTELVELRKGVEKELIITVDFNNTPLIEIYDYWRE